MDNDSDRFSMFSHDNDQHPLPHLKINQKIQSSIVQAAPLFTSTDYLNPGHHHVMKKI
jgi:hypothetical protein